MKLNLRFFECVVSYEDILFEIRAYGTLLGVASSQRGYKVKGAKSGEVIIHGEEIGIESTEYYSFAENVYGQGTISSADFIYSKAYRREKNSSRERSRSTANNGSGKKEILKSKPDTATDDTSETYIPPTSIFEIDKADKAKLDIFLTSFLV